MRRAPVAAVVLLVGAIVAWAVARPSLPPPVGGGDRPAPTSGTPAPDGVAGPPPALSAPSVARAVAAAPVEVERPPGAAPALVVVQGDGRPAADAKVFGFAKRPTGAAPDEDADAAPLRVGRVDAAGRLAWRDVPAAGTWLVVVTTAHVTVFLDGDAVDATRDLVVSLVSRPALDVVVVQADDRTPAHPARIQLELPEGPRVVVEAAAPAGPLEVPREVVAPFVEQGAEADEGGRVLLRPATSGAVRVRVEPSDWNVVAEPAHVDLPRASGTVRFRLLPACRLEVRALDATTGAPVTTPIRVRTWRGDEATPTGGSTTNPDGRGVFDLFPSLRPGTYRLDVEADGYARSAEQHVVLGVAGDRAAVEVRLALAPKDERPGAIRLRLPAPATRAAPWFAPDVVRPGTAPIVLWRPAGDDEAAAWQGGDLGRGGARWDVGPRVLDLEGVAPGRYALYVLDLETRSVGAVAALAVVADRTSEQLVELTAGTTIDLAALVGPTARVVGLTATTPDGRRWPLVTVGVGSLGWSEEADAVAPTRWAPVPAARVQVRWRDARDVVHARDLP